MTQFNDTALYQPEIETLDRDSIRSIQLEKLKKQVAMTYDKVEWYRNKMDEMDVSPSDIQSLDDVKKLPFTDKTALRDTYPYGLFAVPLDEIIELHASSGTTGLPSFDIRGRSRALPPSHAGNFPEEVSCEHSRTFIERLKHSRFENANTSRFHGYNKCADILHGFPLGGSCRASD